jgi:EmrB/QacA subfamily drug resistance transporter
MTEEASITYGSVAGRWVLVATILGSSMVFLDGTVVNVALPAIGRNFNSGIAGLEWVLSGYLITLSALILIGGSLGDLFGRKRVFLIGVAWFSVSSLLCAIAPSIAILTLARVLQGIGGALLVPGSLSIIDASFVAGDRGRAIGTWSGLGGVATAIGPLAGGWLVSAVSWRLIFVLNLPLAVLVVAASRHMPESKSATADRRLDVLGAAQCVLGLGLVTFALIEGPTATSRGPLIAIGAVGLLLLVSFLVVEHRSQHPMLPLELFSSRQFSATNVVTFVVYGALSAVLFLLIVDLQGALGYSALSAGASTIPITFLMLGLSSRAGHLSQRIGPKLPMTVGPLLMAAGLVLMARIHPGSTYWEAVFPAVMVFGLGLSMTVAPLTTTVLTAADVRFAGAASGVNNAVARVAGLLSVAILPNVAGLSGSAYRDAHRLTSGFHHAVFIGAGMCALGGIISLLTIVNPQKLAPEPAPEEPSACALDAPRLGTPTQGSGTQGSATEGKAT